MSDSGQGDGQRSWWEKPDQEPPAQDPYRAGAAPSSAEDAHDPYRSTPPAPDAPTQAHPTAPPTESLPRYGQPSSPYGESGQSGQQSSPWSQQSSSYGQQNDQPTGYGQNQPYPSSYPGQQQHPNQPYPNQQYPNQYGSYGTPQQVPVAGMAHAVLWTSVGGLVLMFTGLGWIAAIVALALTPGARREIMEANGAKRGLGFLFAGKICAWVNIGLTVLLIIGLIVLFGIIGANGGFDDSSTFDPNSVSVLSTH
ncbi:hypothetical protein OG218_21350 [Kineococcus sp. NBC_00420]|uniref:DUF4190 domain-containing protein n=1 Tax=Kineococcus sp. NBC_00420 TaxID=2903564 RepID=UPI002E1A164A